ncbi:MAG: hypothetical protein HY094_10885 [Candidatus Melainabacteria bacterium]|nr:hypothetical protein [Candidatus Melainabacteria bacterium]
MKKYPNFYNEESLQRNQILSSLVLNPPYKIDGFTTSPKISKIFSFPFGLRIDSYLLFKFIFQFMLSMSLFMTVSCFLILCFYLPIEKQNNKLLNTTRSLTSERYSLLANLQEASTYKKLFLNADIYSLKDAKKIIYIKQSGIKVQDKEDSRLIASSNYPVIQFAGF